jgi:hypothetical protein
MKNIIFHCAMLIVLMTSMAASCGSDDAEPLPDNFQSLLGKWKFTHFDGQFTQSNGSVQNISWNASDRGIELYWEFKSNGDFLAIDGNTTISGRWHLEVARTDGTSIDEGTLTLSELPKGSSLEAVFGTEDLIFKVLTNKITENGTTYIGLITEIDASKANDGLKTILRYSYRKV